MMHTLHCYFKPTAGVVVKRQDKRLPDPNRPLSSIISAEAIRNANDAHGQSAQVQGGESLGESKRPRGSYVKLTPVQQAQIAKYALANGNKAANGNGNKAANGNGNDKFSGSRFAHGTRVRSCSTRRVEN